MNANLASLNVQIDKIIADLPESERDAVARVRRELYAIAEIHGHAGVLAVMSLGIATIAAQP